MVVAVMARAYRRARRDRHAWGEPVRFPHKTERACARCGLVKVTRHDGGGHWLEYWRGLERVPGPALPACEATR